MKGNFNGDLGHYSAKVGLTVSLRVEGGTKTHAHAYLCVFMHIRTYTHTHKRMFSSIHNSCLTHPVYPHMYAQDDVHAHFYTHIMALQTAGEYSTTD